MGENSVNTTAAQTNLLMTSAAIAIAATNVFLPVPYSGVPWEEGRASSGQHIIYPFTTPTSVTVVGIRNESSEATNAVARTQVQTGIRWNGYVARRLQSLRVGASDFTGLKAPSAWIVDRAWAVANNYFSPTTPPPSVVPTEDGNILYVWRKYGWELDLEISSEEATVWAYHQKSGHTWAGTFGERQIEFYNLLDLLGRS